MLRISLARVLSEQVGFKAKEGSWRYMDGRMVLSEQVGFKVFVSEPKIPEFHYVFSEQVGFKGHLLPFSR